MPIPELLSDATIQFLIRFAHHPVGAVIVDADACHARRIEYARRSCGH
jgi:hypothetical protein